MREVVAWVLLVCVSVIAYHNWTRWEFWANEWRDLFFESSTDED